MSRLIRVMSGCLSILITFSAAAGSLSKASIGGQVQQFLDDGKVNGCGVTLSAIENGSSAKDVLRVFNLSFMMSNSSAGLIKGRASTVTGAQVLSGNLRPNSLKVLKTEMVWAKAQGAEATTLFAGQSIQKSEDPGYIMYLTPLSPLIALIGAIYDESPIQIGMKTADQNYDVVLFGKVDMSDDEKAILSNCLGEWKSHVLERN